MSQTIPNPFAIAPSRRKPRREVAVRLLGAGKGLAMVAILFAVLIVAQTQTRRWLLDRWVSGLSDLPPAAQIERLLQIDALGDIATHTIASRLASTDDTIAATAYELLRDHQNEWAMREAGDLGRAHKNMVAGLSEVANQLSGQRARWAKSLLDQTIVECVDRRDRETDDAYRTANEVIAILAATNGSVPSSDSLPSQMDNLMAISASDIPTLVPLTSRVQMVERPATEQVVQTNDVVVVEDLVAIQPGPRIMPVVNNQSVSPSMMTEPSRQISPLRPMTLSSLEAFDTKSVIGLLGSQQTDARDQAVDELVKRGLTNEEIRVANQLASPIVDVRLGLLESISHRSDIDPRPWLLWLAEDSNREVRMRSISLLATMNDAAVNQKLRLRLPHEHDPAVIAHLNRALSVK